MRGRAFVQQQLEEIIMRIRPILTMAAGGLALLVGVGAAASNGIQFDEFDTGGDLYVECLGEILAFEEHIEVASHVFETPSGTFHVVDNWTFYITATGTISGRQWYGKLASPFQYNGASAQVQQYAIRGVLRGVTKDTPGFAWTGFYKSTVNANGEMVVERDSGGFSASCRGKN